ncbi:dynein axonemal heavy chain 1-like [Halichoeres trimaculatus]|uniref:dynein axonemal heavy chain 1-like n=1 Tax=Halichoeres trimaculatus TaxID=147232 RepID=UPI003D9F5B28
MEVKNAPVFGVLVPYPPRKPSRPKPPALNYDHILPSARKCFMKEQNGLCSEAISALNFQSPIAEPEAQQKTQRQSILKFRSCNTSIYPSKVQLPFQTAPGQIPRKLKIERCQREYLKLDLEQLLADKGITSSHLLTRHENSSEPKTTQDNAVSSYLPLEIFDNEEYDCRTPEDWLASCNVGSPDRKTVCGKALLPTEDTITSDDPETTSLEFSWHSVEVLDFSKEKSQYLVRKVHQITSPTAETTEKADTEYWIPRLRLLFIAEDPRVFVERIQHALRQRANAEALILYHLSVDCMPNFSGSPSLDAQSLERIKRHAASAPRLTFTISEQCIGDLEKEVKLEYGRTMNRLSFDNVVKRQPENFPHIILPQKDPQCVPQKGCVTVPCFDYEGKKAAFFSKFQLRNLEVIRVISEIWQECNNVAAMKLFNITSIEPLQLNDFEVLQSQVHTQIHNYLKEKWLVATSNSFHSHLGGFNRGAYNLNESSWEMYTFSKLYKLMVVVRNKMQDSLRFLVQDSLVSLTQAFLDTCDSVLTCPQDLVWGNNLITSSYKPKRDPLFLVDLVLDQTGVHYRPPLGNFEPSVINLFDKGIMATYGILQLDKFVMKEMYIGGDPWLDSVKLCEPFVNELREKVRSALIQAAIPLRAYAAEYEKYLELHNLNMNTYLESHKSDELTAQMVKKEVEQHLKDKELIERSLPASIVIGPFMVQVEAVRKALSNKKKLLANAVLELFAQKLSKQVDDACEECDVISAKLHERPASIEELVEKRNFMGQIPEQLKIYKKQLGKTLADYDLLDSFFFCLSNDDFEKKWTAIGWPQRIINQMEDVAVQDEEDEQLFRETQLADQGDFEERLGSLQMLVARFASYTNIECAQVVANEMRRTDKQLKECLTLAETYNSRERLFGIPVTNYSRLRELVEDFQPFKDLWITTSSWVNWHESWLSDPLSSISPERLERNATDAHETMQKCIQGFKDIPDCQSVAMIICSRIEDFLPNIPLIYGLRNPGMRNRHWEMLSDRIQMKVQPKADLTFARCLELGLQNYADDIAHVAEVAGKEFAIEQALEKIEQEWSNVFFEVLPYQETGTFILESLDKIFQLLDDHIVMTESMSSSPFKKTFEDQINTWDSKLRMIKDMLKEWLTCQRSWLSLEPTFSSDEIHQQLPEEGKKYQQMEQIWRMVMRRVFNTKKVIELCPDAFLLYKLKECNKLLEQVQKGLSEYMEIK